MSDIGLQPEGVRIILLPDPVAEKTKGGIILTDTTKENEKMQNVTGTVVAIGPNADVMFESGPLDIGDRVVYAKHSGIFIDGDDGIEYRLANDEDIFAKKT